MLVGRHAIGFIKIAASVNIFMTQREHILSNKNKIYKFSNYDIHTTYGWRYGTKKIPIFFKAHLYVKVIVLRKFPMDSRVHCWAFVAVLAKPILCSHTGNNCYRKKLIIIKVKIASRLIKWL